MFENQKIKLASNQSLVLNEFDRFWMVSSGEVDVFYADVDEEGEYRSTLKYLYSAGKGELVFSLLTSNQGTNKIKLIVVSKGASLIAINKNRLLNINHLFLKSMIDKWILKTVEKVHENHIPRVHVTLDEFKKVTLKKDSIAYPSKGLVWATVSKGEVEKYCGEVLLNDDIEFNTPIPVSNSLWINSLENTVELNIKSTKEILNDEIFFMLSMNDLQNHLYEKLLKNDVEKIAEERNRITEKIASEKNNLTATLNKLKSIVVGEKNSKTVSPEHKLNNPLFRACQLIGEAIGFNFEAPKYMETYKNNTTNQLYAIAQSSKVRVRKIILRGTWWKEENGHLLAFYKEDKRPVALIQKTPNTYLLKDVLSGNEEIVDYKIAEELEPMSYMFFYGFNDAMTSVKKIGNLLFKELRKTRNI